MHGHVRVVFRHPRVLRKAKEYFHDIRLIIIILVVAAYHAICNSGSHTGRNIGHFCDTLGNNLRCFNFTID